jgi:hypothetical protein
MLCFQKVMYQDCGSSTIWKPQKGNGDLFGFVGEGISPSFF